MSYVNAFGLFVKIQTNLLDIELANGKMQNYRNIVTNQHKI